MLAATPSIGQAEAHRDLNELDNLRWKLSSERFGLIIAPQLIYLHLCVVQELSRS
jgi:hypothetical protein